MVSAPYWPLGYCIIRHLAQEGNALRSGASEKSVYELCTSDGFSGLIGHFRPLKTLQLADIASLKVILVRIHVGEP